MDKGFENEFFYFSPCLSSFYQITSSILFSLRYTDLVHEERPSINILLEAPALTICVEGLYIIQETYHRFNKYFPSSPFSQPISATEVRIRNAGTRSDSVRDQDQAHFHSSQTVRH